MLQLTLHTKRNGVYSYSSETPHLHVIGEFLTMDVLHMPDFMRGFINSVEDEHIKMDACSITTKDDTVIIQHIYLKNLPIVTLPKDRVINLIEHWEEFMSNNRPFQTLVFQEREFGLKQSNSETSQKLEQMQEKIQEIIKENGLKFESESDQ